jgi:UDP-2,3-diacylglucosamine pyrophosphatase LpxH
MIEEKAPSLDQMIDGLDKTKELHESIEKRPVHFEIYEKSEQAIWIFLSDLHLGARGVDYKYFKSIVTLLRKNLNIKVAMVGDLYDNFLHFVSLRGANDSVAPPSVQIDMIMSFLEELDARDQLRIVGLGNHDLIREEKAVGYSVIKKISDSSIRSKILEGKGRIALSVGKDKKSAELYQIIMTHQAAGHSIYNPVHGAMRIARMEGHPDVVVTAHTHNPAMMIYKEAGKDIIAIKCGTFKTKDAYSEYFYCNGKIGIPCIVFCSHEHKMIPFGNPEDLLVYMRGMKK